jgi:dolichol-phosphate mannosyltransferase
MLSAVRIKIARLLDPLLAKAGISPGRFREFIKFAIVGGSGVLVNMGLFFILTRWINMRIEWSSPVAIEISILSNFLLNNIWTFRRRDTDVSFLHRLLRYHMVTGLAGVVNYLILILLVRLAGMPDLLANLIGIVIGMFINFFLNSRWTWKEE